MASNNSKAVNYWYIVPSALSFLEGCSSSDDSSSSDELSSPCFLFGAEGAVSIWDKGGEGKKRVCEWGRGGGAVLYFSYT